MNTVKLTTSQSQILTLKYFFDLENSHFKHKKLFDDYKYPWEVIPKINGYLRQHFQNESSSNQATIQGVVQIQKQQIKIGKGTVIQHGAYIKGPCIIGQNCQIRKGAYIRGNAIIGDNCVIGNSCQVKNSIIMDECIVAHFNYVGDSILGFKSHLSAGAITSNLKLDSTNVQIHIFKQKIDTGMQKFGTILGDYSQIGCHVVLNPGALIGRNSWIYPNISFIGFLKSNSILKLKQETQQVDKVDKVTIQQKN